MQINQISTNAAANKQLIIFDWDGTLMDSISLIVAAMRHAGRVHGYQATDDQIRAIIGLGLLEGIVQLFPTADPKTHQAIAQSYADFYVPKSGESRFFAGILPMLMMLRAQGRALAVATGKKRVGLECVLHASPAKDFFVATRCADESGSKPDPQMLKDILSITGYDLAEAIFVGDSVFDIQMANALGMHSIAVDYGAEKSGVLAAQNPTYQAKSVAELADLLGV